MDILVGILCLLLGLAIAFTGLRLWFVMLPIMGFIFGTVLGLNLMQRLFDDHAFLGWTTGIIVGLLLGAVCAVISYLWWYVGAILSGAFVGGVLGASLFAGLFNVETDWIVAIAAIVGAIIFGIITVALDLPIYMVLVNTAYAGSALALAGLLLVLNRIEPYQLTLRKLEAGVNGVPADASGDQLLNFWQYITDHWYWVLIWFVVAIIGIFGQIKMIAEAIQNMLPAQKYTKAVPTTV